MFEITRFQCYTMDQDLSAAFPEEKIPLLLMEHLRQIL